VRPDGRRPDQLRSLEIIPHFQKHAEGSALIKLGDTWVLCAASVEDGVPPFRAGKGAGWLTAEYSMLPRSTHTRSKRDPGGRGWATAEYSMLPRATHTRNAREVAQGRPSGRTAEIQRLIGRSLRSILDLAAMPDRTLTIDCDVLQADGGTRTAAITGAYVAATLALGRLLLVGDIQAWPITDGLAAVSVGIVSGAPLLDLEYVEDQAAEVDMNVVATATGKLVEIQGTGEQRSFRRDEMDALVDLALKGIEELAAIQAGVLAPTLEEVQTVLAKGPRKPAPPKPEKDLWGRPGPRAK